MGLIYDLPISDIAVSVAQDLYEILAPSDAAIRLRDLVIEQRSDTDSEQLRITISRVTGAPTSGSGGGTITPVPRIPGAPAAGSTVERNNTTQISGGTNTIFHEAGFNVINGLERHWNPDDAPEAAPSTRLVIALPTAPVDAITMTCTATIEEIGG